MPGEHVPSRGLQSRALLSGCLLSFTCELDGDVPALCSREQPPEPPTSPLPWQCHAAFQGLLGETERGQGFLVQCHGPMVGVSSSSPPWHVLRPLQLPRAAPGSAPCAQPLPCPGCCCKDSALHSPVRACQWHQWHVGPHVPEQDLAIGLEMAVLEIQARWLMSPALGSGGVMSKCSFFLRLSSCGVTLGVGTVPKAP